MSYIKTNWINDQTELNAENMNHIEDGIEQAYGQLLLAVDSIAPDECVEGDKYYNTETNKIYIATGTDTWDTTGIDAELGVFYIVLETQNIYTYNGETLVSVGGGAGGGGETLPVGTVLEFPTTDSTKVPDGWLFCDGSAVSRTTYADLFAIIGTSFGAGDGSTTFNLPTKEGLVSVGINSNDTDFDNIGETGGSKYLQEHTHRTAANLNHNSVGLSGSQVTGAVDYGAGTQLYTEGVYNLTTGNSGNLQPYTVTNYIIKATQTTPVQAEVVNDYSTSQENAYSCDYINNSDSYSTSEVKTNKRWLSGETIYRKCFAIPKSQLGSTYVDISHNISNLSLFTHVEGIVKRTDGQFVPLPGNLENTSYRAFFGDFSTTNMSIKYGSGLYDVIDTIYVVVEYIKSS